MSLPTAANGPAPEPSPAPSGFDFITWLEVNRKSLGAGLAIFVVAVLGVMLLRWRSESRESEANRALLAATGTVGAPGARPSAAELQRVAAEYRGTHAAERASLLAADELFKSGKFADAQAAFDRFLDDFPKSPFSGLAAFGTASSLDALGKTNQAAEAYQRVAAGYAGESVSFQAKLGRARLLEAAGRADQALPLYDEVLRDPLAGPLAQIAAVGRGTLVSLHPELEKPAPTMTNSVNVTAPKKP